MFVNVEDNLSCDDDIVIYGAGVDGISAFCTLLNREIRVKCFCDADPFKQEVQIMNKPVISPEMLVSNFKDAKIVIGSLKYEKEIRDFLKEHGVTRIYKAAVRMDDRIQIGHITVIRENWYALIQVSKQKSIYIYGSGELEKELYRKLQLGGIICLGMIENLAQLAEEPFDDKMIVVPEENEQLRQEFEEMGLVHKKHFRFLWDMREVNEYLDKKLRVPDVNLGVSYLFPGKYPGYAVHGDDDAKYKIMILGSSTCHEDFFTYKAWPKLLYERFEQENISVQILNGGIRAYNIQMMTEKLLRDLPDLRPDMVICYSGGANNGLYGYTKAEAPFSNAYVREVYKKANKADGNEFVKCIEGVREQIADDERAEKLAEDYLYACDVMKAICDMKDVKFVNFLYCHAGMCDVNSLSAEDREPCYHYRAFMKNVKGRKVANRFYKNVKERLREWQYDHTELFRNTPGVYIDAIHVNEKGNMMIADDVYKIIRPMMKKEIE